MNVATELPEYRSFFPSRSFLSRDSGRLLIIAGRMQIERLSRNRKYSGLVVEDLPFSSEAYDLAAIAASGNLFGWFTTTAMFIASAEQTRRKTLSLAEPIPAWTPAAARQIDLRFGNARSLKEEIRHSFLQDILQFLRNDRIASKRFSLKLSNSGKIVLVSKPDPERRRSLLIQ